MQYVHLPTHQSAWHRCAVTALVAAMMGCAAPTNPPAPKPLGSKPETGGSPSQTRAESAAKKEAAIQPEPAAILPLPTAPQPGDAVQMTAPGTVETAEASPLVDGSRQPSKAKPFAKGMASWYGPGFHGRRTASGERFNMDALTAAHKTLPFGTLLRVRSVKTGKEVVVRVNDRGPYKHQRIIDLSRGAMAALGLLGRGVTEVELLRE